jgi:negative regulator of flagellin synthesis FlgM
MVEPVSHSAGKARIQRPGTEPAATPGNGLSAAAPQPGAAAAKAVAVDSISISATARTLPSELRTGPPIDIETVERIREAIAENRYPIDIQAITDSLFQSFLEVSR